MAGSRRNTTARPCTALLSSSTCEGGKVGVRQGGDKQCGPAQCTCSNLARAGTAGAPLHSCTAQVPHACTPTHSSRQPAPVAATTYFNGAGEAEPHHVSPPPAPPAANPPPGSPRPAAGAAPPAPGLTGRRTRFPRPSTPGRSRRGSAAGACGTQGTGQYSNGRQLVVTRRILWIRCGQSKNRPLQVAVRGFWSRRLQAQ